MKTRRYTFVVKNIVLTKNPQTTQILKVTVNSIKIKNDCKYKARVQVLPTVSLTHEHKARVKISLQLIRIMYIMIAWIRVLL